MAFRQIAVTGEIHADSTDLNYAVPALWSTPC